MPSLSRIDNCRTVGRLLALLLAFAVAVPSLFAQDWDHNNGRDKDHDPTGSWLVTDMNPLGDKQPSVLATFNGDGTTSATVRGDTIGPVFFSPEHGVWKSTGHRTFSGTFISIEYNGDGVFLGIFEVDANFRLDASGDQYDSNYHAYETLPNGHVNDFGTSTSHGVRITLTPPAL